MKEEKYNSTLKFDKDSLVFLDTKTKGWKTLHKLLDKKGVKWTNVITKEVTHSVCTRHTSDSLFVWQYYDGTYMNKCMRDGLDWSLLTAKKIYSFKEFKYLLENEQRTEIEDTEDMILDLLMSDDSINIELALTLVDNYKMDKRWIPWLLINIHLPSVRKYLRRLGIKYRQWSSTGSTLWHLKRNLKNALNQYHVPDEYLGEFIKIILKK